VSTERQTSGSILLSPAEGRLVGRLVEIVIEADAIVWQVLGADERASLLELKTKVEGGEA
jgi:hypothetical protein